MWEWDFLLLCLRDYFLHICSHVGSTRLKIRILCPPRHPKFGHFLTLFDCVIFGVVFRGLGVMSGIWFLMSCGS